MDIKLIETAENFINEVQAARKVYGNDVCTENGIFYLIGAYTESGVNNYLEKYQKEIEAVIEFANMWAVDITEFNLQTAWDRFMFAAQYICYELQSDEEYLEAA